MPTVDLPAHSVSFTLAEGFGSVVVGGAEALADEGTDSYVRLSTFGSGVRMYDGGDPGFGFIEIPGVIITAVEIVAYAYRESGGAYPPEYIDPEFEQPADDYPTIQYNFVGDGYLGGLNIDNIPLGEYGWVTSALDPAHWFRLLDPSDLPPFTGRLSPEFTAGPADASFYFAEAFVRIAYLAARVTYHPAIRTPAPPLRRKQRNDGLVSAPRRNSGGASSRQHSLRNRGYQ